ncbi:hypothetical protein [Vagococcus fluvialis]|uniref:Uncharacterized protein n=1 Tax=Vagococcus fluvialis TaxID=2738 RepID=A0A7X6D754_9ENTE|nr:hypothetical protein [Vagococcus fluvialis]NKC66723.1 hypothetical protein [Vagococcus fluvialis]
MFDELEVVKKYFNLKKSINRLIRYKSQADDIFYSQNMATRTDYTELGVQTRAFRIEKIAIEHIMALELIDKRIERFELRGRYFNRFLKELPQNDYNELKTSIEKNDYTGLSEKLKNNVLDEIDEIEIMICLREGITVPEKLARIELSEDFDNNLSALSNLFAI